MQHLIRRLAMKWRLHHSKNAPNVEANRAEDPPLDSANKALRFSAHATLDSEAPIMRLPTEVILEIARNTTPCSRACLALSCKRLFCVISDGFPMLVDDLRLAEPPNEGGALYFAANDWPQLYQPERWELLCLLQKDSPQWLACSDCFVLHPSQWFGPTEGTVGPLTRSWPQCRPPKLEHLPRSRVARGVVDLCPCIKLTPSKKRTLLAYLERQRQEQENRASRGSGACLPPNSGPWWHECQAVYDVGVVDTKLHPYLLESGELGVITEYTYNRNLGTIEPLWRLSCPHSYLGDYWNRDLFNHRESHRFDLPCKKCVRRRQCRYCSTRVIWATWPIKLNTSYYRTATTDKILSDEFWMHQIIFPFPRYTRVLYPKSRSHARGEAIEASLPWYKRSFGWHRSHLAEIWHQ